MQSAQEFIESFLREKAEALRSFRQINLDLRKKYFAKDILEYHTKWEEERNKNPASASIIEITDNTGSFITTEVIRKKLWRHRYHLRLSDSKWEIYKEETECFLCKGTGQHADKPCHHCDGVGWKNYSHELPHK
jgi:hypothetical protein